MPRGELVNDRPRTYRVLRMKGNQQEAVSTVTAQDQRRPADSDVSGLSWYEAEDGSLVNLDLAQTIQVYEIDEKFPVIASYNDGSEVVLVTFKTEDEAWNELDAIKKVLVGNIWRGKR